MTLHRWIEKFDPAIPKFWLIALAGITWSVIGFMLCNIAYHWLLSIMIINKLVFFTVGIILAILVYHYLFSKIAQKNITRLSLISDKKCLFAFQAWRSYIIIIIMVSFGYILRHTIAPKQYLAVIYLTIGGALVLASFQYYWYLVRLKISK